MIFVMAEISYDAFPLPAPAFGRFGGQTLARMTGEVTAGPVTALTLRCLLSISAWDGGP